MVIYEPHPVTPDRKAELTAKGYKILDARFKPEAEPEEKPRKPRGKKGKSEASE